MPSDEKSLNSQLAIPRTIIITVLLLFKGVKFGLLGFNGVSCDL